MINSTLYKKELKGSGILLCIFLAIVSMYVSIMINMLTPDTLNMLNEFAKMMPEVMNAVGMGGSEATYMGQLSSYLYGFILILFPMIFTFILSSRLVAKYVEKGSMVTLMAAPVSRRSITVTQSLVLLTNITILIVYVTILEIACSMSNPGQMVIDQLILLNIGLLSLHLCVAGITFLASCVFSDKFAIGSGFCIVMYIIQMMVNANSDVEFLKYINFFTLYDTKLLIEYDINGIIGIIALFVIGLGSFIGGIITFEKKDLFI